MGKERVKHTLGERDSNNDTPFNLAAKNGNISAMLLLLGKKKETDPASVLGAAIMTPSFGNWCSQTDRATVQISSTTRGKTAGQPSTTSWTVLCNRRSMVRVSCRVTYARMCGVDDSMRCHCRI